MQKVVTTLEEVHAESEDKTHEADKSQSYASNESEDEKTKVESKDSSSDEVAPTEVEEAPVMDVSMIVGEKGPFFVQLKSYPLQEWKDGKMDRSHHAPALACKVKIESKGEFVRVLRGPYKTKKIAMNNLKKIKIKEPEAFVTGVQKCLQ
jgi:cell division protein FtsN